MLRSQDGEDCFKGCSKDTVLKTWYGNSGTRASAGYIATLKPAGLRLSRNKQDNDMGRKPGLKIEGTNETDVREEIAAPLLTALGYKRGTSNDIARELTLTYDRQFLGRKKPTDPPLRGRADYVLTVIGAGRWILETKAPNEPIDVDAIEQAISYARHPEISASYSVILNGVRLTVHHTSQTSTEPPLVDLPVSNPESLAEQLSGLLSPVAIRRDCSPPVVDLGKPLAEGLRSRAEIRGGEIHHELFRWSSNFQLSDEQVNHLNEMCRRLSGFRVTVTGGTVHRDDGSRIRAKLTWSMPHDELVRFAIDKKLMDVEYLALGDQISAVRESPTVFDVIGEVEVKEGETLFNLMQWDSENAGVAMKMRYTGQATGYIADYVFQGAFTAQYYCDFPALPFLQVSMETVGTFRIEIDDR